MFQVSGVGPMFGQFTHFKMFAPKDKDNSYSMVRYQTEVKRLYEVLEKRLASLPYLGGEEYTIADTATFEMGGQPQRRTLVQRYQRAASGEDRDGQGRCSNRERTVSSTVAALCEGVIEPFTTGGAALRNCGAVSALSANPRTTSSRALLPGSRRKPLDIS